MKIAVQALADPREPTRKRVSQRIYPHDDLILEVNTIRASRTSAGSDAKVLNEIIMR